MIMEEHYFALSIEEALKVLGSSPSGLNTEEVEKRQKIFGKNALKEEKISLLALFFRQFKSIPIYVLIVAAIISAMIGELVDCAVILFIISINGITGFWQEYKAEVSIAALKKLTESKNILLRDNKEVLLPSSAIVPGDIVVLKDGEIVTADIRLIESSGIMVDESSLTGESIPVIKDHSQILPENSLPYELCNSLLAGTVIVRGSGLGVVTRTGKSTYLASIAEKAAESSPDTPLNKALAFFMKRFVVVIIFLLSSLGIIGFFQGRDVFDLGYILLAGLVASVPEGLPIVITLVMVIGALALSRKQTLIRYLPSVETLGSVTVIASDKTGTITEGQLIVKEVHTSSLDELKKIAALCNDAKNHLGDPLDVALVKWVENTNQIKNNHPRIWSHPFDTRLMLMATAHEIDGQKKLLIKGAFEALKSKAHNANEFEETLEKFLKEGLRVIAFGQGIWDENTDPNSWKIDITGLIGFLDPPKEGVEEAVLAAKAAGIRVIMITGDHPMTAQAIAKSAAIWEENQPIITGKEIESLDEKELLEKLKDSTVLARVLPDHKYKIVKLLQANEQIVAVTGDGVNDVPALKAADIGIAMGSGTEAAKSVSTMIITDNNLKIIVEAIRNARIIADNIRKVIYYLVGTTVQLIVLLSLGIISNLPLPLVAIQILWINLIGDGVQDKTFPFAKEESDVLTRKPRRPEKQFFDLSQVARIAIYGFGVGMVCFLFYLYLKNIYPEPIVSTVLFTCVVVAQWANGIQAQKEKEPFFINIKKSFSINPYVYFAIGLGLILQCTAIYLFPTFFHVVPIEFSLWKYPLGMFFTSFLVVECRKWCEWKWFKPMR